MSAVREASHLRRRFEPFRLDDEAAYRHWRADKLARRAQSAADLIVDVTDPMRLTPAERQALLSRCTNWNMAVYRSASVEPDKNLALALGRQLGLNRIDANWLADEDGVSNITVGESSDGRGGFIPYTDSPIKWHTDGYYHPRERQIRSMVLHCVRPAHNGGVNCLLDHELAYIALRDASPSWARALMADDALTMPGREGEAGIERAAQTGPVFSIDPHDGQLHMRYTARTRSIEWKADVTTREAVAFLARFLATPNLYALSLRLDAGMGIVANNVLHDRSRFVDDAAAPRLLYRARFLDRIRSERTSNGTCEGTNEGSAWRNG